MGISVYLENQVHERSYAGTDVTRKFTHIVAEADSGGLLSGIDPHGDTMFNLVELNRVEEELEGILHRCPELKADIADLRAFFEEVRRKRGYVWISGD
jgi:hypothetical protein